MASVKFTLYSLLCTVESIIYYLNSSGHRVEWRTETVCSIICALSSVQCVQWCHHRPISGKRSSKRGLHDLRKWVFCDSPNRQTDKPHTDMADSVKSIVRQKNQKLKQLTYQNIVKITTHTDTKKYCPIV